MDMHLQTFQKGSFRLQLYVPQPEAVQRAYRQQKAAEPDTPFPYWAQVWPAAEAMAGFLLEHPHYVQNRLVLELAAGLGLPSLVAAFFARRVCCSDGSPEAVSVVRQSATHNGLEQVDCRVINWHRLPDNLAADVLLLSDINYDPAAFEVLYQVVLRFLHGGSSVLLSTPQRLVGRPFIERLLPYCIRQQEVEVPAGAQSMRISILVLSSGKQAQALG